MDNLGPTAGNTPPPPSFYPWQRLPAELQLMVLEIILRMAQPISFRTHSIHLLRGLVSLTLTSKKMRNLSLQAYYSSGIRARWASSTTHSREVTTLYPWTLSLPRTDACLFVHRVVLHLRIDNSFRFDVTRPTEDPEEPLREESLNQWFLLFRPNADHGRAEAKTTQKYTDWQLKFPNIKSLDVVIRVVESLGGGGPAECVERISDSYTIFGASKTTTTLLRPKTVNVEVKGFICDGYTEQGRVAGLVCPHGCSRRVVKVIEDVFKRSNTE